MKKPLVNFILECCSGLYICKKKGPHQVKTKLTEPQHDHLKNVLLCQLYTLYSIFLFSELADHTHLLLENECF